MLSAHDFLRRGSRDDCGLVAVPGVHGVRGDLVLPDSVGLCIEAGTTLRFAQDALLVARGPLKIAGSDDAPVTLEGATGTWGGIAVLDAGAPSTWRNVIVKGTTGVGPTRNRAGVDRGGWMLTGGITFFRSSLALHDSRIEDASSEDGLNVVDAEFEIRDSVFDGFVSDAFDGDFVTGIITGSAFIRVGGDAVDISGSRVEIHDTAIRDVEDKALSVGEASHLEASDVEIRTVGIGVASKDRSHVEAVRLTISNARHAGLAVYQKKPEYGPATIRMSRLIVSDTTHPTLVQKNSWIDLDGERRTGSKLDTEALYAQGILSN